MSDGINGTVEQVNTETDDVKQETENVGLSSRELEITHEDVSNNTIPVKILKYRI